jgi:hypothetical protein
MFARYIPERWLIYHNTKLPGDAGFFLCLPEVFLLHNKFCAYSNPQHLLCIS